MDVLFKSVITCKAMPPDDYRPFEWELSKARNSLQMRAFGLSYEVVPRKMLKRDKSDKNLVRFLGYCEQNRDKKSAFPTCDWSDPYPFFKEVLEQNKGLLDFEDYLFGLLEIKRDFSGLSEPQKKEIACQAAAQVLWFLEKNKIPTLEEMRKRIFNKEHCFFKLFEIGGESLRINARVACNWVSKVCPIPKSLRKGRPGKNGVSSSVFDSLIPIPGIFSEDKTTVNFLKLRFSLACISRLLKTLGWSLDQVVESKFIKFYQGPLKINLLPYSKDWVEEAFLKNGSIFMS